MYSLILNPNHLEMIKDLKYTPVGLGNSEFPEGTLTDKRGNNIRNKNEFYGE